MIAIGIGLHNLGEGLAIGSAYAIGELALGAFLVVGFAIHNTTEGFAIVAPLAARAQPSLRRLVALGLIAGAPAILGAVIGASVNNAELSVLLLGSRRRRDRPGDRADRAGDPRPRRPHARRGDGERDRRRGRSSSISPGC